MSLDNKGNRQSASMDNSNPQHASRNIARSGFRSRSRSPCAKERSSPYPRVGEATERKQRRYSRSRSPRGTTYKASPQRKRLSRSQSPYSRRRSSSRSRSPTRSSSRRKGSQEHNNGGRGGSGRGRGGPRHESTFRSGGRPGDGKPDVWGSKIQREEEEERKKKPVIAEEDKEKPNFGLSGSLAAETNTTVSGAILKYNEPPEARKPSQKWRLYVFKGDKEIGKKKKEKKNMGKGFHDGDMWNEFTNRNRKSCFLIRSPPYPPTKRIPLWQRPKRKPLRSCFVFCSC